MIADVLLRNGHRVLVSTATETPLNIPAGPRIAHRTGRLDEEGLVHLLQEAAVTFVVDATHPYAEQAHRVAYTAAARAGIRCFRWVRPATDLTSYSGILRASNHQEAARLAVVAGHTILLTVGSKNLAPYVSEAARRGRRLIARVLPEASSLEACRLAGLTEKYVVAARGPFSIEENRAILRRLGADVLVTKDGGEAGGLPAKLIAAKQEGCQVVLVTRPLEINSNQVRTVEELLQALQSCQ
jgi:precorrin-6A/cobalt-precorrin-6A reductase